MDQRPSFGSASPMIGGSYVANQMAGGANGLPLQGPTSPGFIPDQQIQPMPGQLPQSTNPMQMSILPQAQPIKQINQQPNIPKGEAQLIIEALAKHLSNLSDHNKHILNHVMPNNSNE